MSKKSLVRSTGTIGIATAVSRVLGFVRDIVIAGLFGTGLEAQAFVVAFRIPNSLRDMVGEGATNAAIVPVLTEYRTLKDDKEFLRISRVLFNVSLAVLTVLTVLGIIFSPWVVRIIAPGFINEPGVFDLTVALNRFIFPYLILIGLTAYTMGILNTLKHFAAPAFGPAILNLTLIISAYLLCPRIGVFGLAVGVLAGGALQLLLNIPVVYRYGVTFSFKEGLRHPAVKRIGRLLIPRAMGSAIYQMSILVDTMLASLYWVVGVGAVPALYYANRLVQFPLAIFGLALAQAALPKMSQEFASKDVERFKDTISFSLRAVFLVMLPASFGLAILGGPIVRVLFERGAFGAYSASITENALFFYSFGLMAYGGVKVLVTSFYSMHDTRTPLKAAFISLILNVVLNLMLMWPLKLGGLALATSIAAVFNFTVLYILLKRKLGDFGTNIIAASLARTLFASIVMGIALKIFMHMKPEFGAAGLFAAIALGIITFGVSGYIFNVGEIRSFVGWAIKRR